MNQQRFSMWLGILIVGAHVTLNLAFVFYWELPEASRAQDISVPLTTAYVAAVVMWFFTHRGIIKSRQKIGMPLVVLILMIVVPFLAALFYLPATFDWTSDRIEGLNEKYLYIESGFGLLFGIVMSELFGYNRTA